MNRRTLILGAISAPFTMLRGRAPREPKQPIHALLISEQPGGVIRGGDVMSDTFLINEYGPETVVPIKRTATVTVQNVTVDGTVDGWEPHSFDWSTNA